MKIKPKEAYTFLIAYTKLVVVVLKEKMSKLFRTH